VGRLPVLRKASVADVGSFPVLKKASVAEVGTEEGFFTRGGERRRPVYRRWGSSLN
jgi:hypothetical protein